MPRHPDPWTIKRVRGYWYYKLRGEKVYHTTGIKIENWKKTKPRAERFAQERAGVSSSARQYNTFGDYAAPYFLPDSCPWFNREHGRNNKIQENYRDQHRSRLEIHLLPQFENVLIPDLSAVAFERWLYSLDYASQTLKHILETAMIIFHDMRREKLISFSPKEDIVAPVVRHKERDIPTDFEASVLFPEEFVALKAVWGPRRYRMGIMLALAYSSGMRISELRALRWPAIHWDLNGLVVVTTINRDGKPGAPKAKSVRAIPVPEWTLNILKTLPGRKKDKTGFVFPGRKPGEPLDIGAGNHSIKWVIRNLLDENKKQIIKSDLSPHGLRHGYNTRMRSILAESGFDQFFDEKNGFQASTKATDDVLRAFTGHKSMNMTELYDHPELLKQLKFYDKHFRSYIERFWEFREMIKKQNEKNQETITA